MLHDLARLAGVTGLLALAVVAVAAVARRRGVRTALPRSAGTTMAVATILFALANLHGAGSVLNQARRDAAGPRAGRDRCLTETNGEPGPQLAARAPFVQWLRTRLPAGASYAVAPYAGPPDTWCLALALLPVLPAAPGRAPEWIIAFGTVPPALAERIRRHDVRVSRFAPGFALARTVPR